MTTRLKRKREPLATLRYRAIIWRVYIVEGFWFAVEMTLLVIFMVWFGGIVHGIISPAVTAVFDSVGIVRTDLPPRPARQ